VKEFICIYLIVTSYSSQTLTHLLKEKTTKHTHTHVMGCLRCMQPTREAEDWWWAGQRAASSTPPLQLSQEKHAIVCLQPLTYCKIIEYRKSVFSSFNYCKKCDIYLVWEDRFCELKCIFWNIKQSQMEKLSTAKF
jgi:hypothetical protein